MGTLRFILAIAVVFAHTTPLFGITLLSGKVAVQTFFVISGFYMSLILNEKYVAKNSYYLFITNRLLRLLPIYYIVLLLSIGFSALVYSDTPDKFSTFGMHALYSHIIDLKIYIFFILSNLVFFYQDIIHFLVINQETGNLELIPKNGHNIIFASHFLFIPQAWTLAIELMFYLIAPFIVRRSLKVIGVIMLLSLLLRVGLYTYGYSYDPWTYRFFPTELLFFLLGSVMYKAYLRIKTLNIPDNIMRYSFTAMCLMISIYSICIFSTEKFDYLFISGISVLLPFLFLASKNWAFDKYIGELSYPIYISHLLIINIVYQIDGGTGNETVLTTIIMILTVALSALLNTLVIERIEKMRQRRLIIKSK